MTFAEGVVEALDRWGNAKVGRYICAKGLERAKKSKAKTVGGMWRALVRLRPLHALWIVQCFSQRQFSDVNYVEDDWPENLNRARRYLKGYGAGWAESKAHLLRI